MKTARELLKEVASPFQKTFEPDGDNLYLEDQVIKLMQWYAEEVVKNISSNLPVSGSDFKNQVTKLATASKEFEKAVKEFHKIVGNDF